jgi:hypothetical protein
MLRVKVGASKSYNGKPQKQCANKNDTKPTPDNRFSLFTRLGEGINDGVTSGALCKDGMARKTFACRKRVAKGEKKDNVRERVFASRVRPRAPRGCAFCSIGEAWLQM